MAYRLGWAIRNNKTGNLMHWFMTDKLEADCKLEIINLEHYSVVPVKMEEFRRKPKRRTKLKREHY